MCDFFKKFINKSKSSSISYEKEFEIFSNNVDIVAKLFYLSTGVNQKLNQKILNHPDTYQSSFFNKIQNQQARFWSTLNYASIVSCIISLGRIFTQKEQKDRKGNILESHCIDRLFTAINLNTFCKEQLKQRRPDVSDAYLASVYEFNQKDLKTLKKYISETKSLWDNIRDIRNKILAHESVISAENKKEILEKAEIEKIKEIIDRLLTIQQILLYSYTNGTKPNFEQKYLGLEYAMNKDIDNVISEIN